MVVLNRMCDGQSTRNTARLFERHSAESIGADKLHSRDEFRLNFIAAHRLLRGSSPGLPVVEVTQTDKAQLQRTQRGRSAVRDVQFVVQPLDSRIYRGIRRPEVAGDRLGPQALQLELEYAKVERGKFGRLDEVVAQLGVDVGAAVNIVGRGVQEPDALSKNGIFDGVARGRSTLPGVVAACRDSSTRHMVCTGKRAWFALMSSKTACTSCRLCLRTRP